MRRIIVNILSIIFFLITGINILFPKVAYECYIFLSLYSAEIFLFIEDALYFFVLLFS